MENILSLLTENPTLLMEYNAMAYRVWVDSDEDDEVPGTVLHMAFDLDVEGTLREDLELKFLVEGLGSDGFYMYSNSIVLRDIYGEEHEMQVFRAFTRTEMCNYKI